MHGFALLLLCVLAVCCTESTGGRPTADHRIGYRFFPNDPSPLDTAVMVHDSMTVGMLRLLDRMQDGTVIHAAWNNFVSPQLQAAMVAQLQVYPAARVYLVMDPHNHLQYPDSARPILDAAASIRLENAYRAHAGAFANAAGEHGQMRNNFMLFRNLAPDGPDDGAFGLLFCTSEFPTDSALPKIAEAVWLYGDSSLYERFLGYWEAIVKGDSPILSAQSHTYSNLHDHQAWFFPGIEAAAAAASLLEPLEQGLVATRQPAKVRWTLTGIDRCHVPFLQTLARLQQSQEIDLKIVCAGSIGVHPAVAEAMSDLQKGTLRYFPPTLPGMQSRMLLIDGPYRLAQGSPIETRKLSFYLGGDLYLSDLKMNSMTWLRISDANLLESGERHFDAIWSMSADTSHLSIVSRSPSQRCD